MLGLNLNSKATKPHPGFLPKKAAAPKAKSPLFPTQNGEPKDTVSSGSLFPMESSRALEAKSLLPNLALDSSPEPSVSTSPKSENLPATPKLSLDNLNAAQTAAMSALPATASAALKEVWGVLEGFQESQTQLLGLLADGTLGRSEQDSTVSERLHSLSSKDRASGFDPRNLTIETIALLAKPEKSVYQGADRLSCGAANMELQLTESPALLTRIVDDLSSPDGISKVGKDAKLHRLSNVEEWDGTGRNSVDRLLQGALMNFAGEAKGAYDPLSDKFANGAQGLKVTEIAQASATLEGQDYAVLVHDGETAKEVQRVLKSLPKDESIQLGVSWGNEDHIVTLLERDGDMANYFDSINHENERMPLADLLFKTQVAIVPAKYLGDINVPDDALYTFSPE